MENDHLPKSFRSYSEYKKFLDDVDQTIFQIANEERGRKAGAFPFPHSCLEPEEKLLIWFGKIGKKTRSLWSAMRRRK
jgi:hypothetical protein